MTKTQMNVLSKIFSAEIENRLPWQGKSKHLAELQSQGLILKATKVYPGRFKITVEGWALSDAGRLQYCAKCAGSKDSEPQHLCGVCQKPIGEHDTSCNACGSTDCED